MTDDYRDDHEFGTELGALYLVADRDQHKVILRQLFAGAAHREHPVAAALAVWRGGLASYPLPDGHRLACRSDPARTDCPRRRLEIESSGPNPAAASSRSAAPTGPAATGPARRSCPQTAWPTATTTFWSTGSDPDADRTGTTTTSVARAHRRTAW